MKTLTAEMKAELAANRVAAEINSRIRTKAPAPNLSEPTNRKLRVLPERKEDFYRGMNPVSRSYEVYEYED